ncbi:EamA family transporter [Kitasatospora sp. NPDC052896]|uniref:EamA family transporter n=1 Tax=Kitasatospora sp. NPDC052896 TaxID=3364061 RepID=UPI0037C88F6C
MRDEGEEVDVLVSVAVLAAAVLHASWNALAHGVRDKLLVFALLNVAYLACALVLVCLAPLPDRAAWPYLATSATLQVLYLVLLLQAYRLGDFGQMYPLARGSSVWLVAILSTVLLGRPLPAGELVGVLVISGGLAGLAFADGLPRRDQLPALAAALGTGVMIASYTLVDGTGVRQAGSVLGYVAWLFLLQSPVLPLLVLARRGRGVLAELRPLCRRGLAGGVLSLVAYGLVVWAQSRAALATVAALRETSIVIAALIGTLVFHERLGRLRMAASGAVLAGIAVLELAHG